LYVFAAAAAVVNAAEIVSFGYGAGGTEENVGDKHKTNVVLAYIIIMVPEWSIQKRIPLQPFPLNPYLS
jgi:hypothetical protein